MFRSGAQRYRRGCQLPLRARPVGRPFGGHEGGGFASPRCVMRLGVGLDSSRCFKREPPRSSPDRRSARTTNPARTPEEAWAACLETFAHSDPRLAVGAGLGGSSRARIPAGPSERQRAAVSSLQAGGHADSTPRRAAADFVAGPRSTLVDGGEVVRPAAYSLSASTGIRRCPAGSTARSASLKVAAPSRGGSPSPAKVTCVGRIWSWTLTMVQPMSTGTVPPATGAGPGRASDGHSEPLQRGPRYAGADRDLGILEPGAPLVADSDGDRQLHYYVPHDQGA